MSSRRNPYEWRATNDRARTVERTDLLEQIAHDLSRGDNVVLVGGLGTGKTVLLQQLRERLRADGDRAVAFLSQPPASRTVESVLREVLRLLEPDPAALDLVLSKFSHRRSATTSRDPFDGVDVGRLPFDKVVEAVLEARGHEQAVLIFDELDQYVEATETRGLAREVFNRIETWTRSLKPRLAVVAAGGVGLFGVRTLLGSDFSENACWREMKPLTEAQVDELALPFQDDGRPLSDDVRSQLRLFAGGQAALTQYGLQEMWSLDRSPTPLDLAFIYRRFELDRPFIEAYWRKIASPMISSATRRVLDVVRAQSPAVASRMIRDAIAQAPEPVTLSPRDVLSLLVSAGLLRVVGERTAEPLTLELIPSVLQPLPEASPTRGDLRDALVEQLVRMLGFVHRLGVDFFVGKGDERSLVPEAVLSSSLALQLLQAGWLVEREAVRAAGRTDLLVGQVAFSQRAVVETKIWNRNDYEEVHAQVCGYMAADVSTGVAVMFTDHATKDWAADYEKKCLQGRCERHERLASNAPLIARFAACSTLADGRAITVDHMLLQLPRPARATKTSP